MKSVLSKDVKRLTAVFFAALFAAILLTGCVTIKVKPAELEPVKYVYAKDGYAVSMEIAPNVKYCKDLKAAEDDAKSAGRGLWRYGDFINGEGEANK